MEDTLSKALQRYYKRKGKRIIFTNGMTLNELAWEMWERLGFEGIDPSVLSRVLKGERFFTKKQLEVYCDLLSISGPDKVLLYDRYYSNLFHRYKIIPTYFTAINWIVNFLFRKINFLMSL